MFSPNRNILCNIDLNKYCDFKADLQTESC